MEENLLFVQKMLLKNSKLKNEARELATNVNTACDLF